MKRLFLILLICLIPCASFGLEEMGDKEMDQVTGRFGAGAVADAGTLSTPASEAGFHVGNVSPAGEPTSIAISAILDGAEANDRQDDVTKMTTYFVDSNNIRVAATLGFF